jgi:hypothetical protein
MERRTGHDHFSVCTRRRDMGTQVNEYGQREVGVSCLRLCRWTAIEMDKESQHNLKHATRAKTENRQGTRRWMELRLWSCSWCELFALGVRGGSDQGASPGRARSSAKVPWSKPFCGECPPTYPLSPLRPIDLQGLLPASIELPSARI